MLDVFEWLRTHGQATDREIRDALFGEHADMNMVRPRITDLKRLGFVREAGRRVDSATGVPVRVVEALSRPPFDTPLRDGVDYLVEAVADA